MIRRRLGDYSKRTSRAERFAWRFRSLVVGVVNGFRTEHCSSDGDFAGAMTYVRFSRDRGWFRMESAVRKRTT